MGPIFLFYFLLMPMSTRSVMIEGGVLPCGFFLRSVLFVSHGSVGEVRSPVGLEKMRARQLFPVVVREAVFVSRYG